MPVDRTIKLRGGTTVQWAAANPVLSPREVGIETDTNKFKFGDGLNAWEDLPYAVAAASGSSTVNWSDILGKPGVYPPEDHTHDISDVIDLQADLDDLQDSIDALAAASGDIMGTLASSSTFVESITGRNFTLGVSSHVSGEVFLARISPFEDITVSQLQMLTGTSGFSGTTVARMALYTFDGTTYTKVAQTANDTSLFAASGTSYTRSFDTTGGFPATYAMLAGGEYAIGIVWTGTSGGRIVHQNAPAILTGLTPVTAARFTGQTDLAATYTYAGSSTQRIYGRAF